MISAEIIRSQNGQLEQVVEIYFDRSGLIAKGKSAYWLALISLIPLLVIFISLRIEGYREIVISIGYIVLSISTVFTIRYLGRLLKRH